MKQSYISLLVAILSLIPNMVFGQTPILGTVSDFVLFSSVGAMTNSGVSHITGNVGTNSGAISGFGMINGNMHDGDAATASSSSDLLVAYNQLDSTTPTFFPAPAIGNGDTLIAGVYYISSAAILSDHLILNAQGNTNAVFIFQIQGTFSTNTYSAIILVNGAQACNVFWKVEGLVDMAAGTTMRGTMIVHNAAINIAAGDTLEGRALTTNGAINVDGAVLYTPIGCGRPALTGPIAPSLGTTACYALFSSVGAVSNSGATHVTGDIGTNSGLTTGYSTSFVTGTIHPTPDGSTGTCAGDLTTLNNYLDTLTYDIELLNPTLLGNNLVLTPHTYYLNSAAILTDTLYLDAEGNTNAVFVIRVNGAFLTSSYSIIKLVNGTQIKNVFWNVYGAVTLGDNSVFNGTIASSGAILIYTGATINGRVLTTNGALTTTANLVLANVMPDASAITNVSNICIGSLIFLNDSITGGRWSISNTNATIGSLTGVVTGISAGLDTIIYTVSNACGSVSVSASISVSPFVTSSPTNNGPICSGNSVVLTANPYGGANTYNWSGPNLFSASAQNPIATPTVTTVYSLTVTNSIGDTGCNSGTVYTTIVIVDPQPQAQPTNSGPVCLGGNVTLYANLSAGITSFTWTGPGLSSTTSLNPTIVPTVTSTYSLTITNVSGSGYSPVNVYTTLVNVWPIPVLAPYNNGPICKGGSVTLSGNPSSGALTYIWNGPNMASSTSQNPIATPSVTSTYSVTTTNSTGASGCNPATIYTTVVTVNPTPVASPTNGGAICRSGTATLNANPAGGTSIYTWNGYGIYPSSLQNPTVTPSVTTTYSLTVSSGIGPGCSPATIYTTTVIVNSSPMASPANSGFICSGGTITLNANPSGGAGVYNWSGPNLSATTIQNPTATPIVTSIYSLTVANGSSLSGCSPSTVYTTQVTVIENPSAISGIASVCTGTTSTLNSSGGGTWISSNTSVATIASISGIVTGVAAGTVTISYLLSTGCFATHQFTVNPLPSIVTVSGGGSACSNVTITATSSGGSIYYQGITSGGISTANPSVSQIINASGCYYFRVQSGAGCWGNEDSAVVSISSLLGFTTLCIGTTSILTDPDGAGTWLSSNTSVAIIGSLSGIVNGLTTGTTTITYVPVSGCTISSIVTVIALPVAITGVTSLCAGQNITLSNAIAGGVWSSNAPTIATIGSSSGIVNGIAGSLTAIISYTFGSGCLVTYNITVNALSPITGSVTSICQGQSTLLSDALIGGTWTSNHIGIATIGSGSGIVTGISSGTATISYSLSNGCMSTYVISVAPLHPIVGSAGICVGQSTTYTNTLSDGAWSSQSPTIASVSPAGMVTGIAGGLNTVILYTLSTGCISSMTINVNPLANISGPNSVCVSQSISLTDVVSGGLWTSSGEAIASVGSLDGSVYGISAGVVIISYTLSTGCMSTRIVNVNPLSPITGSSFVCNGLSISLTNAISGGVWTSSSPTMASVGAISGIVTGAAAGFTPTITYTLGNGCKTIRIVTVSALSAISGGTSICQSQQITVTNTNTGGTWTSADVSIAIIGISGIITGVSAGTTTISYALPTGCTTTRTEKVNASQLPNGLNRLCIATTINLTDLVAPGIWSSNNTDIATIGSYSGTVSGITQGIAVVTYKILSSGCRTTFTINVLSEPGVITGSASICAGSTTTYTNPTPYGKWFSGNVTVASVDSMTGTITGLSNGTSQITYTTGCGCNKFLTKMITVANSPITGLIALCVSDTTSLRNSSAGGTWISSHTSVANIGIGTGLVTALSPGTSIISYTNGSCTAIVVLNVTQASSQISGLPTLCSGGNTLLYDSVAQGFWKSSNSAVATIDSVTGIISGVSSGTCIISYSTGCGSAATVTTTVLPSISSITGAGSICIGATATLNDEGGGIWMSSNTSIATINPIEGLLTGISSGTTIISYIVGSGCIATTIEYIISGPESIFGSPSVCQSATMTLTNTSSGGIWTSSTIGNATIGSTTGILTGVSSGTTTITFTTISGCTVNMVISILPLPLSIIGASSLCVGTTTNYSDTGGGTWTTGSSGIATIDYFSGILSGLSAGTITLSYILPTGCLTSRLINVNALPSAISGTANVCIGSSTTLGDLISGSWTSANLSIATIGSAYGSVIGIGVGTTIISFTTATGCIATSPFSVNVLPSAITGILSTCVGSITTLSDDIGGSWTLSNTTIASINSSSGLVVGVSAGTALITFTSDLGCKTISVFTVNPLPSATSGPFALCIGQQVTLTNATGGTWSGSDNAIATIGSGTGIVSGLTSGIVTITYCSFGGCITIHTETINSLPGSTTGSLDVVIGGTSGLVSGTVGGNWTSSNSSVAVIDSLSGLLIGVSAGTTILTYTLSTGCYITSLAFVNTIASITGSANICMGLSGILADATTGGTWTSSNSAIASIGSTSGLITSVSIGSAIISYVVPTLGFRTLVINVRSIPSAISGATSVCVGKTATLTDATAGGYWTCSSPTIATVNSASGVVTGIAGGLIATISYVTAIGCSYSTTIAVNSLGVISGATSVCTGQNITLTDAISGGSWASSNTGVSTIVPYTGIISGVGSGTSLISYIMSTGCTSTFVVTVNAILPISGPASVCHNQTITLTNIGGGTWTSSAPTIASISPSSGIVTGIAAGLTAIITYTLGSGCRVLASVSVTPIGSINGTLNTCLGQTTTLTNSVSGGSWTSSSVGIAIVNSSSGLVTPVTYGTSVISYLMPTGCKTGAIVLIDNLAPIIGPTNVCFGQSIILTNSISGGTWTSSAPTIASINSSTGVLMGNAGNLTSIISYTLASGCRATMTITVNQLQPISGSATSVCIGQSTTLADASSGGKWSSYAPGIANIGSVTGIVTGVSAGSNIISYVMPTGCTSTYALAVNPLTSITGPGSVCKYSSIILSNATSGGTWSSSAPTIATVIPATGVVTGIAPNLTATITYTLGTGCRTTTIITVNPIPAIAEISGASTVSISSGAITLTDATTGGTWTSSNPAKATVTSNTGHVTGVSIGSTVITYTITNAAGCANIATKVIAVGPSAPDKDENTTAINDMQLSDGNIVLIPNPNQGDFLLKGALKTTADVDLAIEVLDILGQVVYHGKAEINAGLVNEPLKLSITLANGMYNLNLHTSVEHYTFHFVLER